MSIILLVKLKGEVPKFRELPGRVIRALPRTTIQPMSSTDLHATCRSRVWGFVDDLRFTLVPDRHMITVHSAARGGIVDFGVNR